MLSGMWRRVVWYVGINVSEESAFTTFRLLSILHPEQGESSPPPPPPAPFSKACIELYSHPCRQQFLSPIPNQNHPPNEKFKRQSPFVESHVPNNSKSDLKIILNTFNQTCSVEFLTWLSLSLRIYASCLFLSYWLFWQGNPSTFSDIHISNKMIPLYKLPITNGVSRQGYCCRVGRGLQPLHIKTPRSKYRNIKECYLCAVIFLLPSFPHTHRMADGRKVYDLRV
jgi:hypothetical protein